MEYISYNQIVNILKLNKNNPQYNPKKFETVLRHIEEINNIIKDREKAEEIVNLAQIGEFDILRTMYQ